MLKMVLMSVVVLLSSEGAQGRGLRQLKARVASRVLLAQQMQKSILLSQLLSVGVSSPAVLSFVLVSNDGMPDRISRSDESSSSPDQVRSWRYRPSRGKGRSTSPDSPDSGRPAWDRQRERGRKSTSP